MLFEHLVVFISPIKNLFPSPDAILSTSIIFQNVNNDFSLQFQISIIKMFYFKIKIKENV